MKKIFLFMTILFLINILSGCIDPPPGGVFEPDIENIGLICHLTEKYNDNEDEIVEWIINGTITNNDNRTLERIFIQGYFYDETGKYLQYHKSYDYNENLAPGESFDFEINWYFGDTEGNLIADIDQLPQDVTYDCEIMNTRFSTE